MSEQEQPSVGAMLREMRGRGVQLAELGRMLDRSPRMISKIMSGKTSGESYRAAVTELHTRGTVTTPPPRRTTSDGQMVPVRGHDGTLTSPAAHTAPTPPSSDTGAASGPVRRRFTEKTTVLPGGARLIEVTAPKTKTAKGRAAANVSFVSAVRRGAQGQRWDTKRVKFTVETADGRGFPIGSKWGYAVSEVLNRSHGFAGDAMGWLLTQAMGRYDGVGGADNPIVGVTMTIYNNRDQRTVSR